MYTYVEKTEYGTYQKSCNALLKRVEPILKGKYGLSGQFCIIGSAAFACVTASGDGSFDLDYNYTISKNKNNLSYKQIRDKIRAEIDAQATRRGFKHGQDSTSVIFYKNEKSSRFRGFDLGIIIVKDNARHRLIYDKKSNQYILNEIKQSYDLDEKVRKIRMAGKNGLLRDTYLRIKNSDKRNEDGSEYTSIQLFAEAVNQVS